MGGEEAESEDVDAPSRDDEVSSAETEGSPPPETAPPPATMAWTLGWLALAALVLVVGRFLPVPGLDREMLAELADQGGIAGLYTPAVYAVGASVPLLVLVHGLLVVFGRRDRRGPRLLGASVYFAITAVQGFAMGMWLESLNALTPFGDLVPNPGLAFRLGTAITWLAAAAVVWFLAERLDATRRMHGALALLLIGSVLDGFDHASSAGVYLAQGVIAPVAASAVLAMPVFLVFAAAVLAIRPLRAWPARLFIVPLHGPIDLLGVIALAMWFGPTELRPGFGTLVAPTLGLGATAVVTYFVFSRGEPGRGVGRFGPLAAMSLVLASTLGCVAVPWLARGGLERAMAPGPLEGEAAYALVLEAEDRFAAGDAEAMVARLTAHGATVEVEDASPRRITLRFRASATPEVVLEALTPHELTLQLSRPLPDRVLAVLPDGLRQEERRFGPVPEIAVSGECEVLERFIEDEDGISGCVLAAEEQAVDPYGAPDDLRAGQAECALHCLDTDVWITNDDVVDADVRVDPMNALPLVGVELSEDAAARFERETAAHIDDRLAIVVDGRVLSAPVITSAIPGGQLQITLGRADHEGSTAQARALADALRPDGRLRSRFVVAEIAY